MGKRQGKLTASWLFGSIAAACLVPGAAAQSASAESAAAPSSGLALLRGSTDPSEISDPKQRYVWNVVDDGGVFCGAVFEDQDRSGALQSGVCPRRDASRGVMFGYGGLVTEIGVFDLRGGMVQFATTDAVTIDRLIVNSAFQLAQKNTAVTLGFTDRLFGDRLTIATDVSWTRDSMSLRSGDLEPLIEGAMPKDRNGSARWHRVEAKIIDTPELRWSAAGEYSLIDDAYYVSESGRPRVAVTMPGERSSLSTSFKGFGVNFAGAAERFAGPYGARETERVKMEVDGLSVVLKSRRTEAASIVDPSLLLGRASKDSVTFEASADALMPAFFEDIEELTPFVPELVSLTWAQGYNESAIDPAARNHLSGMEVFASWSGKAGDTVALYMRESKDPAAPSQGGSVRQFMDVSHTVRWGAWRIGVDATMIDYSSTGEGGFDDATLAGGFHLAYEVTDGPRFKFRIGHDRSRFGMSDESFLFTQSVSDIAISLDLSAYLRKLLDRRDMHLTFEYRKKLDNTVEVAPFWGIEESTFRDDRDGLVASFSTPL